MRTLLRDTELGTVVQPRYSRARRRFALRQKLFSPSEATRDVDRSADKRTRSIQRRVLNLEAPGGRPLRYQRPHRCTGDEPYCKQSRSSPRPLRVRRVRATSARMCSRDRSGCSRCDGTRGRVSISSRALRAINMHYSLLGSPHESLSLCICASTGRGASPVCRIQPPPRSLYRVTRLVRRFRRAATSVCWPAYRLVCAVSTLR